MTKKIYNYTFTCPKCGNNEIHCDTKNATVVEKVLLADATQEEINKAYDGDDDDYLTVFYLGGEFDNYHCSICDWKIPIDNFPGKAPHAKLIAFLEDQMLEVMEKL